MSVEELRQQAKLKLLRDQAKAKLAGSQASGEVNSATGNLPPADKPAEPGPGVLGRASNAALGALQGVTANLSDEIGGVGNAAIDKVLSLGKSDFGKDYERYRDVSRGLNKSAQDESKGEYGFGEILGSLGLPGGGAKSALGAAAKLGGMGALSGFGASEKTGAGLVGDALLGGALGGLTGGLSQGAANTVRKAAEVLPEVATGSAVKTFNPTTMQMEKIQALPGGEKGLGRLLLDLGIVKAGDTAESSAAKFTPAFKQAGKDVGAVYEAAQAAAPQGFSVDKLVEAFGDRVGKMRGNAATAEFAPQAEKMGMQAIQTYGDSMPFTKAHEYASKMGKLAYGTGGMDPGVSKALREETSDVVKSALRKDVESILGEGALTEKDQIYKQLAALKRPARRTLAGNKSGRAVSASDYWTAGTGATMGAAIGGALGGPPGAALGSLAGGGGAALINRKLRDYGRAALAEGADKGAMAAAQLVKALEAGEPVTNVIQKAAALGIPREVIESIQEER